MSKVKINKREFEWGDLTVRMLGRPLVKFIGIEYNESQEKEHLYAAGRHAHGIQRGRVKVDGTLTLLQSEATALVAAAKAQGYDSVLGLSVDLVMTYLSDTGISTTDVIYSAEFTENPRTMKENDMKMEISLPFLALSVEHDTSPTKSTL